MELDGRDLKLDLGGGDVGLLQEELAQLGIEVPDSERGERSYGKETYAAVRRFQREHGVEATGVVDAETAKLINDAVDVAAGRREKPRGKQEPANGETAPSEYIIDGVVVSPDRPGVGGLTIRILDRNIPDDDTLAEATTDELGRYASSFLASDVRNGKVQPDLQTRVYAGDRLLASSEVRYNAGFRETLNVEIPAGATELLSEHDTLAAAISDHFEGRLAELEETDERSDITYLANKTGWDARAVAMAALADQFSEHRPEGADAGIHPAFYYALFRAGVAANPEVVYQASPAMVERVWKSAIDDGLIGPGLAKQLRGSIKTYTALAAERSLDYQPVPGTSTLKDIASLTLDRDEDRRTFAGLLTSHPGDPTTLWKEVERSFGPEAASGLRLDGQLAYATRNNAPVIKRLRGAHGDDLSAASDLASLGYFRPDAWKDAIADDIPENIPGEKAAERRANYADYLSAHVRLAYPTAVVGEMVRSGALPVLADGKQADDVRRGVHAFLTDRQGEFQIGAEPIDRYVERKKLADAITAPVRAEIQRVQRVYQLTPSDTAMPALMKNGLDSAYRIAAYDEAAFVSRFQAELGGEETARLTWAKSQQIHHAVLNLAMSYLTARGAQPLGLDREQAFLGPTTTGKPKDSTAVAYPTLEKLFGSLDYCACEHCRSILSPAAYLVNLLNFLDRPPSDPGPNPLDVLLERRPDLEHLPLTCENTNVALPYIDVVNETLEYFVKNGLNLAGYTGHDTSADASSEELIAEAEFVEPDAYDKLEQAKFPSPLPFNRWLEAQRALFDAIGVPLASAMETLAVRAEDDPPSHPAYEWLDVLLERLSLSRAEYALLTDSSMGVRELYGFDSLSEAKAIAQVSNVKWFTRRLGLSYSEVIEVLSTRFINPDAYLIPRLKHLGLSYGTIHDFKEGKISEKDLEARLRPGLDATDYGGDVKKWLRDDARYKAIMGLITIVPGDARGSFDQATFRYADPGRTDQPLQSLDFIRLHRFIRLWKKLGWTIDQTDAAITALAPARLPAGGTKSKDLARLDALFTGLVPRLGVVVDVMTRLKLRPANELLSLLACWGPIDTNGQESTYRKMFLNPAFLRQDAVFADNGFGEFLTNPKEQLGDHSEAIRGALSVTADELAEIMAVLGFTDRTNLSLDSVSAIYRCAWLARTLRLSVGEFFSLTALTGLDPFTEPDPPSPAIRRLIDLVGALRGAGVKPVEAVFLLWNRDLSGNSVPEDGAAVALARAARVAFATVDSDFTASEDPDGSVTTGWLALVYGEESAELILGLVDGTLVKEWDYTHPSGKLERKITRVTQAIGYDNVRKKLTFAGLMSRDTQKALKAVQGVNSGFKSSVDELYKSIQESAVSLFAQYPELEALVTGYATSEVQPAERHADLIEKLLPELRRRRKRQLALDSVTAASRTSLELADIVLDDAGVLHAASSADKAALDDLLAIEEGGLSVEFFMRATATGGSVRPESPGWLDYGAGTKNPLPRRRGGGRISGRWTGYIDPPTTGDYNFLIDADRGATVSLQVDGNDIDPQGDKTPWRNASEVTLTAGMPSKLVLTVENLKDRLVVRWQDKDGPREVIPSASLFPAARVEAIRAAYLRYLKAASLATALGLTPAELAWLVVRPALEIDKEPWLNALTVTGEPGETTARGLAAVLETLLEYSRLKRPLAPDDERLLTVLRAPSSRTADGNDALVSLTNWDGPSLETLRRHWHKIPPPDRAELQEVAMFGRIFDAFALLETIRAAASATISAVTNRPDAGVVAQFKSALRARYDEAGWRAFVKPINDQLRGRQRDALVAYILQHIDDPDIDTPDKLFEYFLMDVEMDPCMQTSRIRHALSSVQLFIERCLMNLEPRGVARAHRREPVGVDEALPRLGGQPQGVPLAGELARARAPRRPVALLQGDDERAAPGRHHRGRRRRRASQLPLKARGGREARAVRHLLRRRASTGHGRRHRRTSLARTAGAHRKYFYRRCEYGYWTPWEQIKLDIEDNPVVPVVWNGRLLLFLASGQKENPLDRRTDGRWAPRPDVIRLDQPGHESTVAAKLGEDKSAKPLSEISLTDVKDDEERRAFEPSNIDVSAVLCWSEYYNGKWQPTKTSDVARAGACLGRSDQNGFDRSLLRLGGSCGRR